MASILGFKFNSYYDSYAKNVIALVLVKFEFHKIKEIAIVTWYHQKCLHAVYEIANKRVSCGFCLNGTVLTSFFAYSCIRALHGLASLEKPPSIWLNLLMPWTLQPFLCSSMGVRQEPCYMWVFKPLFSCFFLLGLLWFYSLVPYSMHLCSISMTSSLCIVRMYLPPEISLVFLKNLSIVLFEARSLCSCSHPKLVSGTIRGM